MSDEEDRPDHFANFLEELHNLGLSDRDAAFVSLALAMKIAAQYGEAETIEKMTVGSAADEDTSGVNGQ